MRQLLAGTVSALNCTAGFSCESPGLNVPNPCSAVGSFCPAGTTVAQNICPAGSFCATPLLKVNCPRGSFCPNSTVAPLLCFPGSFNSNLSQTSIDACLICMAGTFSAANATTCSKCSAGLYAPVSNTSSCLFCPAGTWSLDSRHVCHGYFYISFRLTVLSGFYCPSSGMSVPLICSLGAFCPTGASIPTNCSAGTKNSLLKQESNSSCIACDPGTFCPTGTPLICMIVWPRNRKLLELLRVGFRRRTDRRRVFFFK
jgi:hypothetical protein